MTKRERAKAAWDRWPGAKEFSRPGFGDEGNFRVVHEAGQDEVWALVLAHLRSEIGYFQQNGERRPYLERLYALAYRASR